MLTGPYTKVEKAALEPLAEVICQLGMGAAPYEALGLVFLETADGEPRVVQLENTAMESEGDARVEGDVILDAVIEQYGSHREPGTLTDSIIFWHTHPHGQVGPSDIDLAQRAEMPLWRFMVVSIPSGEWTEY